MTGDITAGPVAHVLAQPRPDESAGDELLRGADAGVRHAVQQLEVVPSEGIWNDRPR